MIWPKAQGYRPRALANKTSSRPLLLLDQCKQVVEIGHIAANGDGIAANLLRRHVQFSLAPAPDEDVGAFGDKPFGGGQPDTAATPG